MPITPPTPFPELNAVLNSFVAGVQKALGANFVAAFLQGSFAVGDFDRHSDVDFLVVTEEDISDAHVQALQTLHAAIFALDSEWARHLEGSYFAGNVLNRPESVGRDALWYLDNTHSSLTRSLHDNAWVVRWVTREYGIVLAGPEPKTLLAPIDETALRDEVRQAMRDWGAQLAASPEQMNNQWCWPFAVLSFCRMRQTLETGTIESKLAGARWGQQHLDARWTGLIQRAWELRPNPSEKVRLPADSGDVEQTQDFIRDALNERGR